MYEHILIPTDGSALSEKAVKEGIAIAKVISAKVTGVYVRPHFYHLIDYAENIDATILDKYEEVANEQAKTHLAFVEQAAKAQGVACETLVVSGESPYEGIISTAEDKGCDLIFMASHGRRGLSGLLIGSETLKVLTHCNIPVLVCR